MAESGLQRLLATLEPPPIETFAVPRVVASDLDLTMLKAALSETRDFNVWRLAQCVPVYARLGDDCVPEGFVCPVASPSSESFDPLVLGKDVWELVARKLSFERLLHLRATCRLLRSVCSTVLMRRFAPRIRSFAPAAVSPAQLDDIFFCCREIVSCWRRLLLSADALLSVTGLVEYRHTELEKLVVSYNQTANMVQVRAMAVSDLAHACRGVGDRLKSLRDLTLSVSDENAQMSQHCRALRVAVERAFIEDHATRINGPFRGRGYYNRDPDVMEKALAGERLLEKELPELPEQDVRAQAPPERKAPSLDEWIGMLHAWRDALRAGRTSVEAAVETLTRHERQLSEDMLRMQLQESKMTSYCHLADTVARGVFNSVTAELMNFQTTLVRLYSERQKMVSSAEYYKRRFEQEIRDPVAVLLRQVESSYAEIRRLDAMKTPYDAGFNVGEPSAVEAGDAAASIVTTVVRLNHHAHDSVPEATSVFFYEGSDLCRRRVMSEPMMLD